MSYKVVLYLTWWMRMFSCSKGYYFQREFRFNGDDSRDAMEGRLEIRYNDQWGYVCAAGFSLVEGDVVCKNMESRLGQRLVNHTVPALEVYPISNFSLEAALIILEGVKCIGSEDRLYECQHNGLFNASCPSSAIVGLKCGRRPSDYVADTDIRMNRLTKTFLGFNDPQNLNYYPRTGSYSYKTPYWWGYACEKSKKYRQGVIHCDGINLEATRVFLTENNAVFGVRENYCTRNEASEIHCGTFDECSEFNNNSVICIADDLQIGNSQWNHREAQLRLVEGNSSLEGRLEVSLDGGIWGSVCSRFWDFGSARFACQQLGFSGVEDYGTVKGKASYPMLQYLSCNDEDEIYWYDCLHRYTRPEKIVCDSYATVKCSDFPNERALRLMGTTVLDEGRVEIFRDGVWGGINIRDSKAHDVVCNQLGYPGRNRSRATIELKISTKSPVLLEITECEGVEASILDCVHRWYRHFDVYSGGAKTRCNRPGNFTPRLNNGTSVYEGRLEIWEGNQWRRVCSSTVGRREAEIICRQLGHKSLETFYNWPEFGHGINPVLSWSFSCDHAVTFLNQCNYSYITTRNLNCDSVAVKCLRKEKKRSLFGTGSSVVKLILGVFFSLVGVATVLGLVFFTAKRSGMCNNDPPDEIHGPQMPPDYRSLQTISPEVDRSDQYFYSTDATPPPPYRSLFAGHSEPEATVEPDSCNQILNTSV